MGSASSVSRDPSPPPVDLRPLTTSELIDRGFTLYRSHFMALLLLAVLSQSAPLLEQVMVTALKLTPPVDELFAHPELAYTRMPLLLGLTMLSQVVPFCFDVIMTYYIADAYLGQTPSVGASMRRFTKSIGPTLWTFVLIRVMIGLTFLFPVAALGAVGFYLHAFPPQGDYFQLVLIGIVALLLLLASIVPVLAVFMRLMVTVPALALESLSGWPAIRRSSQLVRYDPGLGILYWGEMRLSFLLLPLFVIELLVISLTSLPVTIHQFGEVIRHGSQVAAPPDSTLIATQILTFLAGSMILPLYAIATTLFYFDVRVRREGFDLEFLTGRLEPRS